MTAPDPTRHSIPESEVEEQLQRILSSQVFQRASRPSRFLEFVVKHSLRQPGKPPAESDVATAVFDRVDFDSRLDPIVRVEAARLRKRLREYYANNGKDDPVRFSLPERGYMAEFERMTRNAGDKARTAECEDTAPRTAVQLAVLPFANLSDDESMNAFCMGLTEDVIAAVTDLSGVCVVSRTTASRYSGEAVDVREIGKELGVSHVLEGSARLGDTLYRANVNLVDCSGGFATWSKQFEIASEGDVLMLQTSLGSSIAEALEEQIRIILAAGSGKATGGGAATQE